MKREAADSAICLGKERLDRVGALLAGCGLVGTSAWLYWAELAGNTRAPGGDKPALAILVAVATWAGQTSSAQARRGAVKYPLDISAAAMVVGFAYLSPLLALAAVASGCLGALLDHARFSLRSWRWGRLGLPFGAQLLTVASSFSLYRYLLGPASPAHRVGWQAGAVAVVVAVVANHLLWYVVPWLRREHANRPRLVWLARQALFEILGGAVLGLVTVSLVRVDSWDAVLVALVGGVAAYGYRSALESRRAHDELAALYHLVAALASLTDVEDVAQRVLEETRKLMRADRAELVFRGAGRDGVPARCEYDGTGPPRWERAGKLSVFDSQVFAGTAPLAMAGCPGDLCAAPARRLAPVDTLVAPFDREDPAEGYLLATGRARRGFGFDRTEQRFFQAFASSAGTALRSGQLFSHLRSEVAVREHQARHDPLTGLPNRLMFTERLSSALAASDGTCMAVLLADLDDFKDVNDAIGHSAGDEVLVEVAHRLLPFAGEASLIARLGGDEFGVLVAHADDPGKARTLAEQIVQALAAPISVEGVTLDVRASIGIAPAAPSGRARDAVNLLRHADVALYAAKASGDRICEYDPGQDRSTMRSLTLATELRRALDKGGLELWYQPVVDLATGEVTGCEALLRWPHPDLGQISPVELIPVAENSGLIDPLTWWALDTALGQLREWRPRMPHMHMAVNLSARSLPTNQVQSRVGQALSLAGLPPSALTLELTESSMLREPETCYRVLAELTEMGVGLSIDDYGTGFSSLSRLKQLPFRDLKIDRSFVKELVNDKGDEAIVRSTIELARNLGRFVIAEGVEDKATLHRLAALGCHAAQGYYLAKPLPPKECEMWLTAFMRWPSTVIEDPVSQRSSNGLVGRKDERSRT
ncbi:MAG TPA: bifunctional diguanylate cyclase/phosphodiesterase [Acidimicrobiales bacterium]|nr:bifunctional diguanylate cyclase/phosphodiesterase [Acidimicrobiales bacterium]